MSASKTGHIECVRALIEANATVDHARPDGRTALMSASLKGHVECVRALLEAKANVHLRLNGSGITALDIRVGHCAISRPVRMRTSFVE